MRWLHRAMASSCDGFIVRWLHRAMASSCGQSSVVRAQPSFQGCIKLKISIIIPVINEADCISKAIERARLVDADEVLFIDGGSTDGTVELIFAAGCSLIPSEPGRGRQLRLGAQRATGDVFLFLHADNWLPPGSLAQIRQCQIPFTQLWGGFEQCIGDSSLKYRCLARGNGLRVRTWGLVYGDQGMFVSRQLYERVGGIPDQPLMEDYELSRRLARQFKPMLLPGPIHVSSRRWESRGVIRQTIKNWSLVLRYRCGQSPERLASLYRRHDKKAIGKH